MRRKKLLFLGVDTSTGDAIEYAKSKNVYTIVTDFYSPDIKEEKKAADEYWMIDVADYEALKKRCIEEGVTNIYAGNHEFCLDQCKRLCKELGFPFYASDEGWSAARDKGIYKEKCQEVGLLTPKKYSLDKDFSEKDLEMIQYPVIVKPSDAFGRKGLSFVFDRDALEEAYDKALTYSENKRVIVEEYVIGPDVLIGCYIHHKKPHVLHVTSLHISVIDNRAQTAFGDHFGKYRSLVDDHLLSKYEELINSLNCENGACMFQCVSRDGLIYNIEFSYRLDGVRTWKRIERLTGINQLNFMVDLALGECVPDDSLIFRESNEMCLDYYIVSKPGEIAEIKGRDEIYSRDDLIVLWDRYNEGDTVEDTGDMRTIAFIIEVFGKTYRELKEKVIGINKIVHLYDENRQDMLIYKEPDYENW